MADESCGAQVSTRSPQSTRGADRRMAFVSWLSSLSRGLYHVREPLALRRVFEDGLQRMLPVRDVKIRDHGLRLSPGISSGARTPESLSFEVPSRDATRLAVLEAALDPASGLDDWDVQVLTAASHVAALLLEIERSRLPRLVPVPLRSGRDGRRPSSDRVPGSACCASEWRESP